MSTVYILDSCFRTNWSILQTHLSFSQLTAKEARWLCWEKASSSLGGGAHFFTWELLFAVLMSHLHLSYATTAAIPMAGHVPHWSGYWPSSTNVILRVLPWTYLLTVDLPDNLHSWLTQTTVTSPALLPSLLYCGGAPPAGKVISCLPSHDFQVLYCLPSPALAAAKLHLPPCLASIFFVKNQKT